MKFRVRAYLYYGVRVYAVEKKRLFWFGWSIINSHYSLSGANDELKRLEGA